MAKLSKVEKFYIEQQINLSTEQIAKDLKRPVATIKQYRNNFLRTKFVAQDVKTPDVEPPLTNLSDKPISAIEFLQRRTSSNKKGIVAMTEAASSRGDASGKAVSTKPMSRRTNSIRKIYDE